MHGMHACMHACMHASNGWIPYFPRPLADAPVLIDSASTLCVLDGNIVFLFHVINSRWVGGRGNRRSNTNSRRATYCMDSVEAAVATEE